MNKRARTLFGAIILIVFVVASIIFIVSIIEGQGTVLIREGKNVSIDETDFKATVNPEHIKCSGYYPQEKGFMQKCCYERIILKKEKVIEKLEFEKPEIVNIISDEAIKDIKTEWFEEYQVNITDYNQSITDYNQSITGHNQSCLKDYYSCLEDYYNYTLYILNESECNISECIIGYHLENKTRWSSFIDVSFDKKLRTRTCFFVPYPSHGVFDDRFKINDVNYTIALPTWNTTTQVDWDLGDYENVSSNSSGAIILNHSVYLSDPDMVLWYHLDNDSNYNESDSVVFDFSDAENNGTPAGGVTANETGMFGKAYGFDGSEDYIEMGDVLDIGTNDISISLWMKVIEPVADRIVSKQSGSGDGYILLMSYGYLRGGIQTGGSFYDAISTETINDSNWHYIAMTIDRDVATGIKLYIDGEASYSSQDNPTGVSGTDIDVSDPLRIGARSGATPDNFFNGLIDEVAIWNRSLTASEIADHYRRKAGYYNSTINDSGSSQIWKNMTWTEGAPYGYELPNDQTDESLTTFGGANMTGNVLLFHLNNDSSYTENDTRVYDFSGNGNNGTNGSTGMGANETGKFGKAFGFDGTDDSVLIEHSESLNLSNSITVAIWVKRDGVQGDYDRIAEKGSATGADRSWFMGFQAGGEAVYFQFKDVDGGYSPAVHGEIIPDGKWAHIVTTYEQENLKIYTNGKLSDTEPYDVVMAIVVHPITLGYEYPGAYYFKGAIDEVAIWNRSLSATEIANLYERGVGNVTFQVRSCDDATCSGDSWEGPDGTANTFFSESPGDLKNVSINRYFQYRSFFTRNKSGNPSLWNVSVDYEAASVNTAPTINLTSPKNATSTTDSTPDFVFNVTDAENTTFDCYLWLNSSSGFGTYTSYGRSNSVSNATSTTITANSTLKDGNYIWYINCSEIGGGNLSSQSQIWNLSKTTPAVTEDGPSGGGGGVGGGGIGKTYECRKDADCGKDGQCWNYKCVKLFDIKIIRADSPIEPEEFLDFTYLIKGMASIKGDVVMEFWLEKDGKIATSGSDTIYLGSFEEKTETTNIFLPADTPTGTYVLHVQINYGEYKVKSYRIVQVGYGLPLVLDMELSELPLIKSGELFEFSATLSFNKDSPVLLYLEEKIKKGNKIAWSRERDLEITKSTTITEKVGELKAGNYQLELIGYYANKTSRSSQGFSVKATTKDFELYVVPALIGFVLFIFCFVLYWERKKIRAGIIKEQKWIKRHKVLVAVSGIFVILGFIAYYLSSIGLISLPNFKEFFVNIFSWIKNSILPYFSLQYEYFYHIVGSIAGLIILITTTIIFRKWLKKRRKKKLGKEKLTRKKTKEPLFITKYKKLFWTLLIIIILAEIIAYLFYSRVLTSTKLQNLWNYIVNWFK